MTQQELEAKLKTLPPEFRKWITIDYGTGDWLWTGGSLKEMPPEAQN